MGMFGKDKICACICDCHNRPFVSEMQIRIPYEQEINRLKHEIYKKDELIKDLAETNKYLSKNKAGD